jgi:alpha-tubulin suppressor-like RCC1 family protein
LFLSEQHSLRNRHHRCASSPPQLTPRGVSFAASFMVGVDPMVVAGAAHTVGLKADGRVVAVGQNAEGQCEVGGWTLK